MASLFANATASLTAAGTSTATGSMSWTPPALPEVAKFWDDIIITGSWSWNGKGTISTLTINGQTVPSGTPFSISLGGSGAPPVTLTCRGGNKNTSGNNFTWNNLQVEYQYTNASQRVCIKVGGAWVDSSAAYKKTGGVWVKTGTPELLDYMNTSGAQWVKGN